MTLFDEKLIRKLTTSPEQVTQEQYHELIKPIQFAEPTNAQSIIHGLVQPVDSRRLYGKILPVLLISLQDAGHPDRALLNFDHFFWSSSEKYFTS